MSNQRTTDLNEILRPAAQQDDFTVALIGPDFGFSGAKLLSDGTYAGIMRLITTVAICIGVSPSTPFQRRYCYKNLGDCLEAYSKITLGSDVPDGWIARRPETPEDIAAKRRPPRMNDDDSFSP